MTADEKRVFIAVVRELLDERYLNGREGLATHRILRAFEHFGRVANGWFPPFLIWNAMLRSANHAAVARSSETERTRDSQISDFCVVLGGSTLPHDHPARPHISDSHMLLQRQAARKRNNHIRRPSEVESSGPIARNGSSFWSTRQGISAVILFLAPLLTSCSVGNLTLVPILAQSLDPPLSTNSQFLSREDHPPREQCMPRLTLIRSTTEIRFEHFESWVTHGITTFAPLAGRREHR
jgi:hypothetical protein